MSSPLSVVQSPRVKRVPRAPTHNFFLQTKPFGIYPFCIAPVLPGETLKNLVLQSRVVTDPVASPLVGWWTEYYFFYVRLRDLPSAMATAAETMLLDPSQTMSGVAGTTDTVQHYFAPGANNGVNYVAGCLERVVETYFRDQDEAWNTYTNDNVPLAKFQGRNWMDSAFTQAEVLTATGDPAISDTEDFNDFETRYQQWLLVRSQHLTDLTFEDYLATFGVNVPRSQQKGKPELLRFTRDWQYPSNTIDPTSGLATSAVSWSVSERADKDRFFIEPGFIFGVTVCRPKTYHAEQTQNATVMLDNAMSWMPALMRDDPSTSLREMVDAAGNSPLNTGAAVNYLCDMRDLYTHGDQFVIAPALISDAEGDYHNLNAAANSHAGWQYPLAADIAKLWVDRDPANLVYVRQDGVVKLNILGTQVDHT